MDGCGENSNCISSLKFFGRAVTPDFAQLLDRVREGQQTNDDVI